MSQEEEGRLYSDTAQEISEDPAIDDGTAIRRLLSVLIDVAENCMVALWDVSDALKLRTHKGKDRPDA